MNQSKKHILLGRIFTFLLVLSLTILLFTSCQNKETNAPKDMRNSAFNRNQNPEEMKKQMEDGIKSLVSDGTINQSQGDKILEILSTQGFGGRRNTNNPQNGNQTNGQQDNQNSGPSNNQNNDNNSNLQGNPPRRTNFNPLSTLVDDGTITQAQADAVMQKIRGNFNGPGGN